MNGEHAMSTITFTLHNTTATLPVETLKDCHGNQRTAVREEALADALVKWRFDDQDHRNIIWKQDDESREANGVAVLWVDEHGKLNTEYLDQAHDGTNLFAAYWVEDLPGTVVNNADQAA